MAIIPEILTCSAEAYFASEKLNPEDYHLRGVSVYDTYPLSGGGSLETMLKSSEVFTSQKFQGKAPDGTRAIVDVIQETVFIQARENKDSNILYKSLRGTAIVPKEKK